MRGIESLRRAVEAWRSAHGGRRGALPLELRREVGLLAAEFGDKRGGRYARLEESADWGVAGQVPRLWPRCGKHTVRRAVVERWSQPARHGRRCKPRRTRGDDPRIA